MTRNRNGRLAGMYISAGTLDDGASLLATTDLRGRLSPKRASGRLAVDYVKVRDAAGAPKDACRIAATPCHATRAAGRTYAGSTSQLEPLVIRLNRARTKATDLLIDWHTETCTRPDDFVYVGEHFQGFPLSGSGAFGDSFTQSYPGQGGGEDDYTDQLHGRIGRSRASGTFRATGTSNDASGATTASCDSAPITWSAIIG
jgi:hypothetical protein